MTLLEDALRAGPAPRRTSASSALLVVGAGGALGAAVLEQLLASRRHAPLRVLVSRRLHAAVHGLEPLVVDAFDSTPVDGAAALAQSAIVVFDRQRHSNGRDDAFVRPRPEALASIGGWLWRHGVRHLVIVMPHDPARLPAALKAGLADLGEHSVAALGFEHVVFVRSAELVRGERAERWLQRVAGGMLAQLRLMQPAASQPVRVSKVAQFVAELAHRLPASPVGTRVAAPELLWQAAQAGHCGEIVAAWLDGRALPAVAAPRRRL